MHTNTHTHTTHIHTHTYTHTHSDIYTHTHDDFKDIRSASKHTHTSFKASTYIHTRARALTHTRARAHAHTLTHTHTHTIRSGKSCNNSSAQHCSLGRLLLIVLRRIFNRRIIRRLETALRASKPAANRNLTLYLFRLVVHQVRRALTDSKVLETVERTAEGRPGISTQAAACAVRRLNERSRLLGPRSAPAPSGVDSDDQKYHSCCCCW